MFKPPAFDNKTKTFPRPQRPRSEKKPIPDEQKDDKYFERRKRNNEAAKKSRSAGCLCCLFYED